MHVVELSQWPPKHIYVNYFTRLARCIVSMHIIFIIISKFLLFIIPNNTLGLTKTNCWSYLNLRPFPGNYYTFYLSSFFGYPSFLTSVIVLSLPTSDGLTKIYCTRKVPRNFHWELEQENGFDKFANIYRT